MHSLSIRQDPNNTQELIMSAVTTYGHWALSTSVMLSREDETVASCQTTLARSFTNNILPRNEDDEFFLY